MCVALAGAMLLLLHCICDICCCCRTFCAVYLWEDSFDIDAYGARYRISLTPSNLPGKYIHINVTEASEFPVTVGPEALLHDVLCKLWVVKGAKLCTVTHWN